MKPANSPVNHKHNRRGRRRWTWQRCTLKRSKSSHLPSPSCVCCGFSGHWCCCCLRWWWWLPCCGGTRHMCANTTPGLKKGNKERSFLGSSVTVRRYTQCSLSWRKNKLQTHNCFILGLKPYTFLWQDNSGHAYCAHITRPDPGLAPHHHCLFLFLESYTCSSYSR